MIHFRLATWHFAGAGLLMLAAASGCGTAQYEKLLAKEITTVRNGAPWARFWDYTTLPGTPVQVRIPEMFKSSYRMDSPHPNDGDRIVHTRAQPPFLDLPGFRMVFEEFYSDGSNRVPYYCYLAAQKASPEQTQALAADLLAKLKAKFPASEPPPAWEEVDCKTPEGTTVAWKKLTVIGDQFFDVDAGPQNGVQTNSMPATFELWLHESQGYYCLIGWRINTQWDKPVGALKMAPLTAGTIRIGDGVAPAPGA